MFKAMNLNKLAMITFILLIVIVGFVIGCSNPFTSKDAHLVCNIGSNPIGFACGDVWFVNGISRNNEGLLSSTNVLSDYFEVRRFFNENRGLFTTIDGYVIPSELANFVNEHFGEFENTGSCGDYQDYGYLFRFLNQCCDKVSGVLVPAEARPDFEMTIHEWVLLEYTKRYNYDHWIDVFLKNIDLLKVDGEINENLVRAFVFDNIHLFGCYNLYTQIAIEAIDNFSLNLNLSDFPNPFSAETKRKLFDINNSYGGVNLFRFNLKESVDDLLTTYSPIFSTVFSTAEHSNFNAMINMVNTNRSLSEIESFLICSEIDPRFSRGYRDIHYFALNTFRFYQNGAILDYMNVGNPDDTDLILAALPAIAVIDIVYSVVMGAACLNGTCKHLIDPPKECIIAGTVGAAVASFGGKWVKMVYYAVKSANLLSN